MHLHIDRQLPVAISAQLLGQIEYGVSCGSLPAGSQLPSVRDLAARLKVSPVTVSQVYRTLQERGLIETRQGLGTFVSGNDGLPPVTASRLNLIYRQIDSLVHSAKRLGVSHDELSQIVHLRLRQPQAQAAPLRLAFVGTFPEPTRAYVSDLRGYLGRGELIEALTFAELAAGATESLKSAHLAITFPHRTHELTPHLAPGTEMVSLRFIPSERTRILLAEISPMATVTLVSTFPEFLGTLRDSAARFAPHVSDFRSTVLGNPKLPEMVDTCDVVVYATGAESVMNGLPGHVRAIEYRHTPDPASVEADLLPAVNELRGVMEQEAR